MQQYLMGLFALALCCAVVEMLSPDGEGGGIARHIKLMSALCLLCVLLSPLVAWLRGGESLPDHLRDFWDGLTQDAEDTDRELLDRWEQESERLDITLAEQTVAEMLEARFALSSEDCRVSLILDDGDNITCVRVALSGRGVWCNTHEMQAYIEQTFGWESVIYIE